MRKFFILNLLLVVFLFGRGVSAQNDRYANCDLCGYCKDITPTPPARNPPSTWEGCRNCLYPSLTGSQAMENETLKVNPTSGLPPAPASGHYYTSIGCINTSLGDFTQPGAAASLSTVLLGLIFRTAGGIAFLYLLYGAFLVLTSQSNPERLEHGKKTIYGAVIGLAFVLLSVFITNFIANQILKIPTG